MALTHAAFALQDMALFVEVARALSFTRASQTSGVPIATLSRRLAQLEQRVGVRLLERSTRRLVLTETGRRYLEHCERIMLEAEIAQEALKTAKERPSGPLRLAMPVEFGLIYIAPLIPEFSRQFPDISLELELSPRQVQMADEQVDVAIRLGEVRDHSLIARPLGQMLRWLCAAPAYLARRGLPQRPAELLQHDCILASYMRHPGVWQLIAADQREEVAVEGRFATNNISMTLSLAEQGHGIAVLSPQIARQALAEGRLVRVLEEWSLPPLAIHALTSTRLQPARVKVFIDFLASRLQL